MSEAMTVETVIDAYWQLQGYWTKLRYPYKKGKGWSDIDVVAYHPLKKELVIAESKVRGKKHSVLVYTSNIRNSGKSFIEFDTLKNGNLHYLSFIENLDPGLLKEIYTYLNIPEETKIVVHLVSNCYVEESILEEVQEELKKEINKRIGSSYTLDRVKIDTTFDMFCEVIKQEEKNNQGKRYGHPIIDIAREINRYINPDVAKKNKDICSHFKNKFDKNLKRE